MYNFRFAGANVTTPWGDTYVDIPAAVQRDSLWYTLDGVEYEVPLESCWAHGQRGYGATDKEGREWGIKRTAGCGCG